MIFFFEQRRGNRKRFEKNGRKFSKREKRYSFMRKKKEKERKREEKIWKHKLTGGQVSEFLSAQVPVYASDKYVKRSRKLFRKSSR